ncbi:MAG TPA: DinB family protein [Pyrinomonadaceae bacterium]|jgi:hypothetical protein|nr:DinB family protein [Pyrinomonadaceae bacterium]
MAREIDMVREIDGDVSAAAEGGQSLAPELEDYRRQFEAIKGDARELVAGLTDAQFNWRQEPGRWSIAECLAHLSVTGQAYLPALSRQIKAGREAGRLSRGPYRRGLLGRLFLRGMEPPAKLKFKAPKLFAPLPEHLLAVVVPAFMSLQDQFVARMREADGVDIGRVKIASPASRFIKISLGDAFALMAAHERRHLWQARQVRDDQNFPK